MTQIYRFATCLVIVSRQFTLNYLIEGKIQIVNKETSVFVTKTNQMQSGYQGLALDHTYALLELGSGKQNQVKRLTSLETLSTSLLLIKFLSLANIIYKTTYIFNFNLLLVSLLPSSPISSPISSMICYKFLTLAFI